MFRLILITLVAVLLWPTIGTAATDEFRLKGVLISPSHKTALINNTIAREGDRVAGATILAIEDRGVRIRKGSQELVVMIGGSAAQSRPVRPTPAAPPEYAVKYGDTLSEISEHYLRDGVSLNQLMMAFFEANPEAFDGNINRLKAGVNLRIPSLDKHLPIPHAVATAQVQRHEDAWRADSHVPIDSHVERFGQLDRSPGIKDRAFPGLADGIVQVAGLDQAVAARGIGAPIAGHRTVAVNGARLPHGIPAVYYRRPH